MALHIARCLLSGSRSTGILPWLAAGIGVCCPGQVPLVFSHGSPQSCVSAVQFNYRWHSPMVLRRSQSLVLRQLPLVFFIDSSQSSMSVVLTELPLVFFHGSPQDFGLLSYVNYRWYSSMPYIPRHRFISSNIIYLGLYLPHLLLIFFFYSYVVINTTNSQHALRHFCIFPLNDPRKSNS